MRMPGLATVQDVTRWKSYRPRFPRVRSSFRAPKAYRPPKLPKVPVFRPRRFLSMPRGPRRPLNACSACSYTWYPRGKDLSAVCPRCKNSAVFIQPPPPFNLGAFLVACALSLLPCGLLLAPTCHSSRHEAQRHEALVETTPSPASDERSVRRLQVVRRCTVWKEVGGNSVVVRKAVAGEVFELVGDGESVWRINEEGGKAYFNKRCAVLLE